jgi:hypothetical protein
VWLWAGMVDLSYAVVIEAENVTDIFGKRIKTAYFHDQTV